MKLQFEHILLIFFLLLVLYYLSRCNRVCGIDSIDGFSVDGENNLISISQNLNLNNCCNTGSVHPAGCYIIKNNDSPKLIYSKLNDIFNSLYNLHNKPSGATHSQFKTLKIGETFKYKESIGSKYTDSFNNVRALYLLNTLSFHNFYSLL